jgi:hypothetical protein
MRPSSEVQIAPAPHPLPYPRQPGTHRRVSSQTVPDVAPPQSASERHSEQFPARSSVDEHSRPAGQPLPPVPRQPGLHVSESASQMTPLSAAPQSASVRQFPQVPVGAQMRDRQSDCASHGWPAGRPHLSSVAKQIPERHSAPSGGGPQVTPFGRPQRLSPGSQTPERHGVHEPPMGSTPGSGLPLGNLGVHTPPAHHSVAAQSASAAHAVPQLPSTGWHFLEPHSASLLHLPQIPPEHTGSCAVGQAADAPDP